MRKLLFVLCVIMIPTVVGAQVFDTGEILRNGKSSAGFNGIFRLREGNEEFFLYFHFNYGLPGRFDLGARVSVVGEETYFGADIEWKLTRRYHAVALSIATGAHNFYNFGLDGTLNLGVAMSRNSSIYLGIDMDIEFVNSETSVPYWVFIGTEIGISRKAALFLEADGGMNDEADNVVCVGIQSLL